MMPYKLIGAILILGFGLWVLGFSLPKFSKVDSEKPTVAATIFPLYDIVKNIAGNNIDVFLILPPGASPHTFEPTPTILREVEKSQTVFAIGYGLDDWTKNLVDDQQKILVVDDGIKLRENDPHYFLTGVNAIQISKNIADSLSKTFPEFANEISRNAKNYQNQLQQMDEEIAIIFQNLTPNTQSLITFHDAWYYFADAYGLTIAGAFEPTAGREPTPQYLAELSDTIKKTGVKIIYAEPQFSTRGMEAFLKDHNISIATIDPEGGGEESTSYIEMMLSNARTIAQNQ